MDALKTKQIDALLVDTYTPVKRKDLFNGSWFEVAELFEAKISQGLILQGSSMHLADELSKLIVAKNVQTNYLLQGNQDQEDDSNEVMALPQTSLIKPYEKYKVIFFISIRFRRILRSYIFLNTGSRYRQGAGDVL